MNSRSAFDLDCHPVIPECGFECPRCIQEIESVLTSMQGVSKVYMEGEGQEQELIVEHDPTTVTVEQLIDVFKDLPSFYEGFFIPTLITNAEEQD
ncbi:MAG: heavy-metal-associated domain-containing protein [Planctomycetota bacterium]|jgi:copper chaperone CopZ